MQGRTPDALSVHATACDRAVAYATILVLRELDITWGHIAEIYAQPNAIAARTFWNRLREKYEPLVQCEQPSRPTRTRECMTCRTAFESEGNHHRMCDECREQSGRVASLALDVYSISPPDHVRIAL